jgi:hypothetical protein
MLQPLAECINTPAAPLKDQPQPLVDYADIDEPDDAAGADWHEVACEYHDATSSPASAATWRRKRDLRAHLTPAHRKVSIR